MTAPATMEWDADGTRHTLKQQSVEWLYWYFADHTKMGEGSLVELAERYALTIPGIDLGRPWADRPLMKVLDSSILAEYGNCDRLMEVLIKPTVSPSHSPLPTSSDQLVAEAERPSPSPA